jgi:hypothetical protein
VERHRPSCLVDGDLERPILMSEQLHPWISRSGTNRMVRLNPQLARAVAEPA